MKPMRERITEYSKGDNLDLFWRLFRLRERSGSRLVTGLLTLVPVSYTHLTLPTKA